MSFQDRFSAAKELSKKMKEYKNSNDTIILAIPRGGIATGYILAKELNIPLDIILTKKIGLQGNKEYAVGAVSLKSYIVDDALMKSGMISKEYIEDEVNKIRELLKKRYKDYKGDKKPYDIKGKIVILTDDGIATGRTILAAIDLLKGEGAKKIVIAVPVGPPDTIKKLEKEVDQVVCILMPEQFLSIGRFYNDFKQVEDEEAIKMLQEVNR